MSGRPAGRGRRLRVFGLPEAGRAGAARALAGQGVAAVTLGVGAAPLVASVAAAGAPAREAGLDLWACRAAFRLEAADAPEGAGAAAGAAAGADDLRARDPDGRPRAWFGSGCPNRPALRRRHLETIGALAGSGAFAGFLLDGIRFASPNAGPAFWTCFCAACAARAAALGIDAARMRRAVAALRAAPGPPAPDPEALVDRLRQTPALADWLRFRAACVLAHVREVRATVDAANGAANGAPPFRLGAYLFAPSLAPLVGQDYGALAPLLDEVSPMLYRTIEGDACLTSEWDALAGMGLVAGRGPWSPDEVAAEVARARAALPAGTPLVPILQLVDDALEATIRGALRAGADGVDLFVYRAGAEAHLARAAAAVRAAPAGPAAPEAG